MVKKTTVKKQEKTNSEKVGLTRIDVHQAVNTLDELRDLKKGVRTSAERISWGTAVMDIPKIWQDTQGEGVKVAVLDTGIDTDHPDLKDAIIAKRDFTGDGIEDVSGHGTHCAGIIAARMNNVGFVGVAPKSELIIAKVLGNNGYGSYNWVAEGISWATKQGAHIISMSLGGPATTNLLFASVHRAMSEGIFIVCAAGNEGSMFPNSIGYPGRYGGVITVAAHDNNGNPSGFSSFGGEIDFMAPGTHIWSTYKNGGYAELSGTSMATPFVAGLAALVTSKHIKDPAANETPLFNNEDLREHLMRMTTHPGWHDNKTGYGILKPFSSFLGEPSFI